MRTGPFVVCLVAGAILGGLSKAGAATIDFEALPAFNLSPPTPGTLDTYLAQYGVTLTGGQMGWADDRLIYGGGVIDAPSGHNVLVSYVPGAPNGVSFTFGFAVAQDSVSFTRTALTACSAYPSWTATGYNGATAVATVGEGPWCTFPAQTFTLNAAQDITSLTFVANGFNFAAFSAPVIDDLVLSNDLRSSDAQVPEPASVLLLGVGLAVAAHRLKRNRTTPTA